MAAKSDKKTGNPRVFAYYGADDSQKRAAVDKLISEVVDKDFADFDFETLYGPDATSNRIMTACGMAPFASKCRLVLVTQANDIPTSEQNQLAEKLDRVPESACLVLVTPAPELKDGKPRSGSELQKELLAAVKKVGKAVDFPLMKDQQAIPFIRSVAEKEGKTITQTAAAAIVRRVGSDTGVLENEIAKLAAYIGDRPAITDADVEEVTIQTAEEKLFAMIDAVGSKDTALAVSLLHPILQGVGSQAQGEALKTLIMLARHYRQLWQARVLLDAGCRNINPEMVPSYLKEILPIDGSILKARDWQISRFIKQANNCAMSDLVYAMERIAATDLAVKGIEGAVSDPVLALEMLVVELSSRKEKSKRGR